MTGRVATATTLVLALAYPFASRAAETVQAESTGPSDTATESARRTAPPPRVAVAASDGVQANPYAGITNEQLADVADRWPTLNRDERRWFFVEVRRRLIAGDGARTLPIGASARFGQVVRGRDGTRVVDGETMGATERTADVGEDPRAYGLGFERRLEVKGGPARSPRGAPGPTPASVRLPIRVDQRPPKPDGGS